MSSLPDPWGDVVTHEDDGDDEDVMDKEHNGLDDDVEPPTLMIKNEPDADDVVDGGAALTETVAGKGSTTTDAVKTSDSPTADARETSNSDSLTAGSNSPNSLTAGMKTSSSLTLGSKTSDSPSLAALALAEEERLASGVNPPNPELRKTITDKLNTTVEGIMQLVKSTMQESAKQGSDDGLLQLVTSSKHSTVNKVTGGDSDEKETAPLDRNHRSKLRQNKPLFGDEIDERTKDVANNDTTKDSDRLLDPIIRKAVVIKKEPEPVAEDLGAVKQSKVADAHRDDVFNHKHRTDTHKGLASEDPYKAKQPGHGDGHNYSRSVGVKSEPGYRDFGSAGRLNSEGEIPSDLTDGDDITDNDIISAQLIDDSDDGLSKSWESTGQESDHTAKDNFTPVKEPVERDPPKQSETTPPSVTSTTVQRMYGLFKQKSSVQSSWGSTQKRARRSCTDSALKMTIPGIAALRKQQPISNENKEENKSATDETVDRPNSDTVLDQKHRSPQKTSIDEARDRLASDSVKDRPYYKGSSEAMEVPHLNMPSRKNNGRTAERSDIMEDSEKCVPDKTYNNSRTGDKPANGTDLLGPYPTVPSVPFVICPQTPPNMRERTAYMEDNNDPAIVDEANIGGVWVGYEPEGTLCSGRTDRRTLLEINTIHILDGLCGVLRSEDRSQAQCASIIESLADVLKSNDPQQNKDDQSRQILGMVDEVIATMSMPKPEVTTSCFPSVEEAGRAFIQSRAQAQKEEQTLHGQLKSEINIMIEKAKSDLIKDLGLKSPKKSPGKKKKSDISPKSKPLASVVHRRDNHLHNRKLLPALKLMPVGSSAPFGRDFGYYSVGARSISYLQYLWHTAYMIANDGIDKIKSNMVIPIVGSIKRQKQGLVKEFGKKEVFHGDLKRRPCRLYKEYDVLHAFYHFHKTIVLANVWFRADYAQMMMPRLQFIHRKLLAQVKYLRQSRDLIRDALQWSEMIDNQRPIFHYAFNSCATFEKRLDKKLEECRAMMDKLRAGGNKNMGHLSVSKNVDSSHLEDLDFDCTSEQKEHRSVSIDRRSDLDSISRISSTHSRGRTRSPSAPVINPPLSVSPARSSASGSSLPEQYKWANNDNDKTTESIDKLIKSGRQKDEQRRFSSDETDKRRNSFTDNRDNHRRFRRRRTRSRSPIRRRRTPSPFQPRRRSPSSGRKRSRSPRKSKVNERSRDRTSDVSKRLSMTNRLAVCCIYCSKFGLDIVLICP